MLNADQRKRAWDLVRRYGKQPTTYMGIMGMLQAIHPHLPPGVMQWGPEIVAGLVGIYLFVFDEDAA